MSTKDKESDLLVPLQFPGYIAKSTNNTHKHPNLCRMGIAQQKPSEKKIPSSNIQKEENIPIIILISPRKCRTNLFLTRNPGNHRAQEEPSPPNTRNSPEW
jgi:hypothetical protein